MPILGSKINTTTVDEQLAPWNYSHAVARDLNGRLWVVYREVGTLSDPAAAVLAAYSDDDGESWTEETVVDNARAVASQRFAILVDSSNVPIVLYVEKPVAGNLKIMYVDRSGGSWGAPELVETMDRSDAAVYLSACIDSGDNIHVAFDYDYSGVGYVKGISGSWGAREVIDANGSRPDIAVDSGNRPYICYSHYTGPADSSFRMRYKTDAWQAAETIFDGDIGISAIALDSEDDIYVAYVMDQGTGIYDLHYNKRTSGVWGSDTLVASPAAGEDFHHPLMTIDTEDNVYFVYQEVSGDDIVYYKKLTSGGSLGEQQTLTEDITPPGVANPSLYAALWAMFPSSSRVGPELQPVVVLLDNPGVGIYNLYYYRNTVTAPSATTDPATGLAAVLATVNGTLNQDGGEACECGFEWGLDTGYGITTPTESKTTGETFSQVIHGLFPGTEYHFRAFATNSAGTSYGADRTFTTSLIISRAYALARREL